MGNHSEPDPHEDMLDFVRTIIDRGELEGKAEGIARFAVDNGYEKLSEKQKFVFDRDVIGEYQDAECIRCGSGVPWSEMDGYRDSQMCSWCEHMSSK